MLLRKKFAKKMHRIRKEFLHFSAAWIGEEEKNEVLDTLNSGWLTRGPKTGIFENNFKNYIGTKYALGLSSCTAALHLALIGYGIKEGDEVITSPFTFAATGNTIIHSGARPVFVDIDEDTLNINTAKIEENITEKTKAIVPVHFAGYPCDMDEINRMATKYGLYVIEDAAHALGAVYKGHKVGTLGDIACFSFYPIKNITTGEGGMIVTNDLTVFGKTRILSLHGMDRDAWGRYSSNGYEEYEILFPGFKYNMTDIQAALGIHQLERLEKFLKIREEYSLLYDQAFREIEEIDIPSNNGDVRHARHLYPILLRIKELTIGRNEFMKELGKRSIGTSVHFMPLHLHPYYRNNFRYRLGNFSVSENVYQRILSLPLYPKMKIEDVQYVIEAVKGIISQYRRIKVK